jgi:sodium-dependent dicarboxylate transporter 2/3/5
MIAGVTSIGAASAETGLARWLVDHTLSGLPRGGAAPVVAIVATFTVLIRLFLPMGPVIVAVVVPPLALLARDAGVNPALYTLPVVFTASCAFLLPLDAVTLVTFSRGYYGMLDMVRPGVLISIAWVIVITGVMTVAGPVLGLF